MLILSDDNYFELAREIGVLTQDSDKRFFGVVELVFDAFDFIFGFDFFDGNIDRALIIVFENGMRCSSNFNLNTLKKWL